MKSITVVVVELKDMGDVYVHASEQKKRVFDKDETAANALSFSSLWRELGVDDMCVFSDLSDWTEEQVTGYLHRNDEDWDTGTNYLHVESSVQSFLDEVRRLKGRQRSIALQQQRKCQFACLQT